MEGVFLQPFQKGGCDAGIPKKGAGGGRLCADPPGGVLPAGEGRAARPRGEGPIPGPAGEGAIIDASINKLRRLLGSFVVECPDEAAQRGLRRFLEDVPVAPPGRG